ncbi:phakinin isoform X1 [Genypterus blacodes]|uniref:phakinin isoform X1 n=1 Tax=Genypterus blacodes TaxID=154954 RepID=UPI003F75D9CF
MPLSRRRSSFLGAPCPERSSSGCGPAAGTFVGSGPPVDRGAGPGTRVSRRALGISSVFLQGLRSSVPAAAPRAPGHSSAPSAGLNGCLMEYRDKVRALEDLNQQLEEQIRLCLDRKASSTGAWGPLRKEWEEVYRQVSDAILENARLMLQTENVQGNAEDFKERYESEESLRKEVQDEIGSLYKVIDDADLTKAELQGQMDDMKAELRSLEHKHEQDVRVLYSHMAGGEPDQPDSPIETSLDRILAYVRDHWEEATERNRAEAHGDQECKAQCVSSRLSPEEEQVEALRLECSDAGGQIQRLQADMESMRALKRGLKNSLSDAKHWHHVELQNVGSVVAKLEAELADVRGEIEQQRYDYDTLLSNKRRLEQEIGLYHGILDREESRVQPAELLAATAPDCRTKAPGPGPGPAEP